MGKLALVSPKARSGKLIVKVPTNKNNDTTRYLIILELGEGKLEPKALKLEKGEYGWSARIDGDVLTLRVTENGADVATVSAPAKDVTGYGLAATCRFVRNEADITMTFDSP